MEAIGTAGTIIGIIDVTSRSISALIDLRQHFKSVDDNLEILISYLTTVRAALRQINALVEEQGITEDDQNYQLVIDLGVAIKSSNTVVSWIDAQIAKVEYNGEDALTFVSKVRLLLDSKATDDCLARLDRQINALNLLFTAFRW